MMLLGVDPGLKGALSFLDTNDRTLEIVDMPTFLATTKNEVNGHAIKDLVRRLCPKEAFVENVHSFPGEGPAGAFSFGKGVGIIHGVLMALDVPYTLVTSTMWKKALGVPTAKDGARSRAVQLLPSYSLYFTRKKDDGRAEASLIALYGARVTGIKLELMQQKPRRERLSADAFL